MALADVRPDDVVLEVGAADGVLTRRLLDAAAHVHAFEIDRRFTGALERLAADRQGLTVHAADALRTDLAMLRPEPTAFVANLAYNIAIPIIMRSIEELPGLRRWAVMVQKELADRLFASPSTKAYSAVSVLVQLACRRVAARPVARTVFSPRPRVDSVFVVFERREPSSGAAGVSWGDTAPIVRAAFEQRRKLLANALSGRPLAGSVVSAAMVRTALERMGLSPTVRAEELPPDRFPELVLSLAAVVGEGGSGGA